MSFLDILYKLLIGPLQLVFEIIFNIAYQAIGHPGWAIVVLSLIVNLLVLPLYRRADAIQKEQRDIEAKLHDGIAHIKKTFSGDERMMMLQTYYRQNNYKPTDVLNSSVSLLLQIPFFIAAYQFLSHLQILQGVSFGPIPDLGTQDALIIIGEISINVLPIIMTLVNVVSSAIYLKGFPFKTKLQLYGMAALFLVLLYNSPAGLVFYWTLNNIFSLVKNLLYKVKLPVKISLPKRKNTVQNVHNSNSKIFLFGSLFITILIGLLIPSTIIAASPQEFVDITYFHNPLWYLVSSMSLAAGTFLIWMRIFYWLASDSGKVIFDKLVWILCAVMLVNYMFFGTKLGVVSSTLQYGGNLYFSVTEVLLNILAVAAVAWILWLVVV
ncbi:MAG: YidC/Oxa1 family membrane protein insertase, partial [Peptococcaceae bacterium]|nr:YidC/Oxa1 family membrane protein insertase [Peptococcaceae bacterium]